MQKFGEKLHQLRVSQRLTLKELAVAFGLNAHGYISEIESGKKKPTADFVLKVARFFDVTTDQLLKDELDIEGK
jgi:transcriptional regulator with XRE-family HTH domain